MDYKKIDDFVLQLVERSTPERTAWNLEKIREGKPASWNYIDGCMLTALMEMDSLTGDPRYFQFVKACVDHFVGEDGSIRTFRPEAHNLDDVNEGRVLFALYGRTGGKIPPGGGFPPGASGRAAPHCGGEFLAQGHLSQPGVAGRHLYGPALLRPA